MSAVYHIPPGLLCPADALQAAKVDLLTHTWADQFCLPLAAHVVLRDGSHRATAALAAGVASLPVRLLAPGEAAPEIDKRLHRAR